MNFRYCFSLAAGKATGRFASNAGQFTPRRASLASAE
jgi:hypothetical protein